MQALQNLAASFLIAGLVTVLAVAIIFDYILSRDRRPRRNASPPLTEDDWLERASPPITEGAWVRMLVAYPEFNIKIGDVGKVTLIGWDDIATRNSRRYFLAFEHVDSVVVDAADAWHFEIVD